MRALKLAAEELVKGSSLEAFDKKVEMIKSVMEKKNKRIDNKDRLLLENHPHKTFKFKEDLKETAKLEEAMQQLIIRDFPHISPIHTITVLIKMIAHELVIEAQAGS